MKKVKGFAIVLVLSVLLNALHININKAEATDNNITVKEYIEYIVKQMNWTVDNTSGQPYIDAAIEKGILKKEDFKDYSAYLTRTDAAVIANRLDEFINQRFGHHKDKYNYLRYCYYFDGRLYFVFDKVIGKRVPVSDLSRIRNDIGDPTYIPQLQEGYPDDKTLKRKFRTKYVIINETLMHMIGNLPEDENNKTDIDPFDENDPIIKAWEEIAAADKMVKTVMEKRISDIRFVPDNKKEEVAFAVAKGLIKGYSNGLYVQSRGLKGSNRITEQGAKDMIQKVLNPNLRAPISPDGQLIRTTNLPKNANEYRYILECFPNDFYEMKFKFMYSDGFDKGKTDKSRYVYPKDIDFDYLYEKYYKKLITEPMDMYAFYDKTLSNVETYLQCIFNVDYRTIDNKWKEKLLSTFNNFSQAEIIDEYISNVKKNHVIAESKHIAVEPSTIYEYDGRLYIRVYVKYRIKADNLNKDHDALIYGRNNNLIGLNNGEWRYGYYDISLDPDNPVYVYALNSIDDTAFMEMQNVNIPSEK